MSAQIPPKWQEIRTRHAGAKDGGAYQYPFELKKHLEDKIIWFDYPGFAGANNGSKIKNDFMALIKGTDQKYCYATFTIDLERKKGPDKEVMSDVVEKTDVAAKDLPPIK
jgi:hypothetical protein